MAGLLQRLQQQNFGPNDSVIASGLMHPQDGLLKMGKWFQDNVNTAAGIPNISNQDEASIYSYGPSDEQKVEAANNLSGLLQTSAFASGAAPASAGGTLGTFIGPKSTGWNTDAANTATKLLDNGVDPAQVWKEHLIGRMPDNSLFSEIDDSKQATQGLNMLTRALEPEAIAQGAPRTMPSWVWMDHPELFDNYPHTGNTMINPTSSIESQGSFDPMSNILNLSAFSKDPKSTTLHEFQHAIQEKEGWARGGSPEMFNQQKEAELARDALNWRRELLNKRKDMPKADWHHIENELVQDYQKQGIFDWVPTREARDLASQPYILHADKYDNGSGLKDLEDLVKMYGLDKRTTPYSPMEGYKRLTGEAQARATQDRMNMNMQQRRDNYPLAGGLLSDIPLDQLINRYR